MRRLPARKEEGFLGRLPLFAHGGRVFPQRSQLMISELNNGYSMDGAINRLTADGASVRDKSDALFGLASNFA